MGSNNHTTYKHKKYRRLSRTNQRFIYPRILSPAAKENKPLRQHREAPATPAYALVPKAGFGWSKIEIM